MKKYFIKILCGVVYLVSFIALGMIFVNLMPKNDLFYVDSNNSDIVCSCAWAYSQGRELQRLPQGKP